MYNLKGRIERLEKKTNIEDDLPKIFYTRIFPPESLTEQQVNRCLEFHNLNISETITVLPCGRCRKTVCGHTITV